MFMLLIFLANFQKLNDLKFASILIISLVQFIPVNKTKKLPKGFRLSQKILFFA